jgi:hypothetical protein
MDHDRSMETHLSWRTQIGYIILINNQNWSTGLCWVQFSSQVYPSFQWSFQQSKINDWTWIQDFVVVTADVRGSSANGDTFKHAVFRQLGAIETKDYIHILKYALVVQASSVSRFYKHKSVILLGSISSTFYTGIFRTKVLRAAFL